MFVTTNGWPGSFPTTLCKVAYTFLHCHQIWRDTSKPDLVTVSGQGIKVELDWVYVCGNSVWLFDELHQHF